MALLPSSEKPLWMGQNYNKMSIGNFDQTLDRKLMEYCKKYPKEFKMVSEQIIDNELEGHEFEFPKKLVTIRQPREKKKMTEEQKLEAAERLQKARKKKRKG